MDEYLKKVFNQIQEFLKSLSPGRKIAMAITAAAVVAGIAAVFMWAGDNSFRSLMTNLTPEDSANVIRVLREKQIPFRVDPSGKNISVPPESIDQLRLELATMGLPQTSTVGYEVFDSQSLSTSSFVQKVNQKRALEGELMRTINSIKGVKRSRVHLAIPKKSTFIEDQKSPKASVVLDLAPGVVLSEKQIYGIGNLVSSAIEGLDQASVVIVDSFGKTLSKNPSDPLAAQTATQLDFQRKYETDLEHRIEAMLARVVGDAGVVARVSADMDFSQVNETSTVYDADGSAVRSVKRDAKTMQGARPGPIGVAGATSNVPGDPAPPAPRITSDTNIQGEQTNYEIPQTIRRTIRPTWNVERLSVAVVVDGKHVTEKTEEGEASSKVVAWPPEKLKEFEQIVATAVGIDPKRGDTIEIKNMEFQRTDFEEAERLIAETERKTYIQNMIVYGVIGLTIVLFFLLVVRPFIKWVTENTIDSVDTFLPQTIEELEKLQKNSTLPGLEESVPVIPDSIDPEKVEGEMIKEKVVTLIEAHPDKAALILKEWLNNNTKKTGGDDPGKSKTA